MHRIDTPNRALALYGAGKDGWRDGVMASGILPTEFNAAFLNSLQEEVAGVVEGAGLVLNPAANNQLLTAIQDLIEVRAGNYVLDTGVANAYVVAFNPVPPARANGLLVRFKVAHANTGASTINDGFGVVPLLNDVGGALLAGDLPLGGVATAVFDATVGAYLMSTLVPSQALTQLQADARYALLGGSAAAVFNVAPATAAPHAARFDQVYGLGQTWQNVTATRVLGTVYTNTTGKAIKIIVQTYTLTAGSGAIAASIAAGAAIQLANGCNGGGSYAMCGTVDVPPGMTYSITSTAALAGWFELR